MTNKVGRPSELTEDLTLQIRGLVLESMSYRDIQETLGISANTWDAWVHKDYKDFRKLLNSWKKERIVKKAETKVESLIGASDERVALQASTFALETLGKEEYSKRSEMTGPNGVPLTVKFDTAFNDAITPKTETNSSK